MSNASSEGHSGSSSSEEEGYDVGDAIEAQWSGDDAWYRGVITKVRGEGMYDVEYDDGETEVKVEEARIRPEAEDEAFCYCQETSRGDMVGCDGGHVCKWGGWFHLECVKLRRPPRGTWRCRDCEARLQAAVRKALAEPVVKKKKKKKRQKRQQKKEKKARIDEYSSDSELESIGPQKVETGERESREFAEELLNSAAPCRFSESGPLLDDAECAGLCRLDLPPETFAHIANIHDRIVRKLRLERRLTAWAGVDEGDVRARGYAFLPGSMGTFGKPALLKAGITFHAASKKKRDAALDERANWRSCVALSESDLNQAERAALASVADCVRNAVPDKYKSVIDMSQLHALQPNLHNGLDHLPPHVDYPLHDGFGVVIVTVCVRDDAHILILPHDDAPALQGQGQEPSPGKNDGETERKVGPRVDDPPAETSTKVGRRRPRAFECKQGQAYVLSGNARNACDHGVVCPLPATRALRNVLATNPGRQSLNLRFGLHSDDPNHPFYAIREMPQVFEDSSDDEH